MNIEKNYNRDIILLNKLSYGIAICSLLIDTCHARAFPSYNIVTAALGLVISHSKGDTKSRIISLGYFTTLTSLSLVVDVIFCTLWGAEVSTIILLIGSKILVVSKDCDNFFT